MKSRGAPLAVAFLLASLLQGASGPASAQPASPQQRVPSVSRGHDVFTVKCAPCHGRGPGDDGRAMLPGTEALQVKYGGETPPALEDRNDLGIELLTLFVRQGTWSMPPFRKTELTDADIADVAAYLADPTARAKRVGKR